MRRSLAAVLLLVASLGTATGAFSQVAPPPRFAAALELFEAERYDEAAEAFEAAYAYGPARWATAAQVMRGKAFYRAGHYDQAEAILHSFLEAHPNSRYADDARATLDFARAAVAMLQQRPRSLGVILSLNGEEAAQSQAIFNGIRMAVDEANQSATGSNRTRLVFRDIGSDAAGAGRAVRSLADEDVGVVLGALFSDQAREAAAAAEARRVVFVAPLATDDRVSRNSPVAFQANPTIEVRGRVLARFAVNGLLLRRFGILSGFDSQGISQAMAEAFQDEVERLGSEVVFFETLQSASDWSRLPDLLDPAGLSRARGLFVPLSGRQPERQANSLIQALESLGADLRVLGNAEWHQLPLSPAADPYGVTYTNDFRVDPSDRTTAAFLRNHRTRFGSEAGRLAHVGYDVTRFVLSAMNGQSNPFDVADALRTAALFEGTGMRIDFHGGQVNEAMYYQRYRDGLIDLLR